MILKVSKVRFTRNFRIELVKESELHRDYVYKTNPSVDHKM